MTTNQKFIPGLDIHAFAKSILPDYENRQKKKSSTPPQFFISRLEDVDTKTLLDSPYIYDFFTVYFIEKGSMLKINQLKSLELNANEIFFSRPGEIKTWQQANDLEGYMLCFTLEYLLLLVCDKNLINTFDFLLPNGKRNFVLDEPWLSLYKSVFNELYKEFPIRKKHSDEIIKLWLFVLLIKTNRMNANGNGTDGLGTKRYTFDFIYRKFMLCLEQNFIDLAQGDVDRPLMVKEFAAELNVSPTYLSECIRRVSGKSVKSIIDRRTLLLAKCQLLHTHNNISEIAYQLGFESSSYFIRFFKRFESKTPLEFRNSFRK
ncbi:helix-turn-helix transcriptional regulator [Aquimarina sp. U1-2]|uniref:AraC family transcriptional regulator n=1 Tax=Aquimarina sp. U1-2 TaxID=2823141 RepID=UPI001AECB970|nr:AraC family transcriptional regulator [Aquimarina sp. U1-2]MBP2831819.1 helix-turn-helix transcriptional regulator [Aquimarina sp. U1-2]